MNLTAAQYSQNHPLEEQTFDGVLVLIISSIILLGLIMVFSAGIAGSSEHFSFEFSHALKQGTHIIVGLGLMAMVMLINLDQLQRLSKLLFALGLLALAILLLPGVGLEINGSTRWLSLVGVRIQPAEAVKLLCLIYVADYYARKQNSVHLFKVGVVNIGLPIIVVGILLLLQPDFGTLVIIIAIVAGLMFIAGVPFGYFVGVIALTLMALAAIAVLEPYRIDRLLSYQDPWADPFDKGFQLTQALMAVGRGGWLGVGLGNSLQKLNYLPHADNDFLIAIVAEELGSIGVIAVMLLFILLLWRAFKIGSFAMQAGQHFQAYLAYGIGLLLTFSAGIHIGVNTGILPTKGLTLPMMSAGGSSLVTSLVAVGLLFSVDRQNRAKSRKTAS